MRIWLVAALLLWGCAEKDTADSCEQVCMMLVDECGYDAFPSYSSCEQGCLYEAGEGMNADGYLDCISTVEECDTYGVVRCDNAHGI
ncbi:MAG: hypothetical protein ACPGTU_08375 [Myxococcota bacterium]